MKKQKGNSQFIIVLIISVIATATFLLLFLQNPPSRNDIQSQQENKPTPTTIVKAISPTIKPENTRETVSAVSLYQKDQLSPWETELISNFNWPKLEDYRSGDKTREVYLVDCQVTNDSLGVALIGVPETVPNVSNIAETTIKKLLDHRYGGFPSDQDIQAYEKFGTTFKNKSIGINGINLKKDGTLVINFYDSVAAYGGGSSLVGCLSLSVNLTMKQFPSVKKVEMCIDKNTDCGMDFQP